jgi:sulfate adenylyltransferase large subunit
MSSAPFAPAAPAAPYLSSANDDFEHFLQQDLAKDFLRFTTAGSVDDGKSTLIGRLLHDTKGVYEDQLASVKKSRINRSSGPVDFSLLTDGLRAEREQGITIDVAYRYFATARRKFIIADTPGHEQYTRNMATGASTASLAVILVDATKGLLPQTRRHSYIAALLGIPNLLVAINKMDLVGYSEEVFLRLQGNFLAVAERLKIATAPCVPVSALEGDNIVDRSRNTPWYSGPTLLEHLETVPIPPLSSVDSLRFPVQYVIRPDSAFRGFAGQVAGGSVRPGDVVMALPSRQTTRVQSIVTFDGQLDTATLAQSVTLKLEDEIDLSRGDMLVSASLPPSISKHFSAAVVWLNEKPLQLNHVYIAKHTTRQVRATVPRIRHRVDVNALHEEPAQSLDMNGIALLELETSSPLFFDPYDQSRSTGSFILIDPLSNATVGAGMIREDLSPHRANRGTQEIAPSQITDPETRGPAIAGTAVTAEERFARHGHRPAIFVVPDRDSLAEAAERALFDQGFAAILLDRSSVAAASLSTVLRTLWSAGFVVLLFGEQPTRETSQLLVTIAGEALFDFASVEHRTSIAQILSHADTLKIQTAARNAGKVD